MLGSAALKVVNPATMRLAGATLQPESLTGDCEGILGALFNMFVLDLVCLSALY